MKKALTTIIASILIICLSATSFASVNSIPVYPSLSFTNSTVRCSVTITAFNKDIDATLTLYRNDTYLASWHRSGTGTLSIFGTAPAYSGDEYTVEVTGTIDGEEIDGVPVSSTCP